MRHNRERGAAMVEFALLLPLLLLVLFGLIDMGRMFLVQSMVTNGAREGARMAALGYSVSQITDRADASMPNLNGVSGGTHVVTPDSTPCPTTLTATSQRSVTVTVSGFNWVALGAVSGLFPGGGITPPQPAATSSMRCFG